MRPRFRKHHGDESPDPGAPVEVAGASTFDDLLSAQLDSRVDHVEISDEFEPDAPERIAAEPVADPAVEQLPEQLPAVPAAVLGDFWENYDRAAIDAEMARIPPASVIAVVGPLEAAAPVVDRCRDQHWMGSTPDVFVLTQRRGIEDRADWTIVAQPSDLVAALEDGDSHFPVVVLDVPCDLPAFVRPLIGRLREAGVGLVHYVLDGDPDDEDLATWHGELGSPSVLDLASPVGPDRILELFDRGEPVVSVAGMALTTELLLAFRGGTAT